MAKILYALTIVLCLFPGILVSATSQQISFDYAAPPSSETPHFSTTPLIGDCINVDDALRALPIPPLTPIRQSNAPLFGDGVEGPLTAFDVTSDDPRPSVWETSEYMIGKVGVYIIFVESDGGLDLDLYDWDKTSINWAKNGIYMALNWWKSQYPFRNPRLEFYVNVETVIGYTKYEPMLRSWEDHKLWVPDVLKRLGCGNGSNYYEIGKSCAHTIRQNWKMDWAFIIFVVNSGTGRPSWSDRRAFAHINGPYIVLPFGWFYHMMFEGTDGLARVVAHEIGHIFGATDEYNSEPELSGYLYERDDDGSGCIMDSSPHQWCISRGTMRQIGWVDDNYNGYPDILENRPSIILLNDTIPVTDADEIIIEGIFKLEPYPCKKPGCRPVTINNVIPINATGVLMALDGSFDTAYEPFRLIYRPDMPGYHTISIAIMDAVVGNIESYDRKVLYTYLEVQSIETTLTTKRVDVGAQIPIKFKVVLAHNKEPLESGRIFVGEFEATPLSGGWFEVKVSSNSVGRYLYQPTSAEVTLNTDVGSGRLTKIKFGESKPVEVVYDRVVVSLSAMKERVDVGSEAPIDIKAWYEYDETPFQGEIQLNEPLKYDKVGLVTYRVSQINDRLYGLKTFEANDAQVIFDKVIITLRSDLKRIDVGSEAPINIDARYAFDSTPFVGKVYLSADKKQDRVGLYRYFATRIEDELYGLNVFETNEVQVIFDTVIIELEAINERVEVGKRANISYRAYYSYDNSPFEGEIFLNNDLAFHDVGPVTYSVSRIIDSKYGLKSFSSNSVKVIFDKIRTLLEIDTITPFTVKVTLRAYYESDDSPVASGVLMIGDYKLYSEKDRPGTYLISYLEMFPVTRLTGRFVVKGFDEIKIDKTVAHVGNIIVYLPAVITISALIIRKRIAGKKPKIIMCPKCGSTHYIGIKIASNVWEYECQSCGKRWYVKR
ncbi:hypothetical protein J7L27_07300 [Candidatus Bathyarchaeota archaeon]|nr:hypothetical protein [Candidatus Bathyarchaeota archaeon]